MTLCIGRASKDYILCVTDRAVTRSTNGQPVDPMANKNVIYSASDGIVTLSYSGLAQLDGIPTDQRIAEELAGIVHERSRKPPVIGLRLIRIERLGQALERLQHGLEQALRQEADTHGMKWAELCFDVCFAGWHWKRNGRYRPIVGGLEKEPGQQHVRLQFADRWFFVPHRFRTFAIGSIEQRDLARVHSKLADSGPLIAEPRLISEIRTASVKESTVGPHCLSILMLPPPRRLVIVRFRPVREHRAHLVSSTGAKTELTIGFSPWLIGERVRGPAVLRGCVDVTLGRYVVRLGEKPQGPGLPFFMGGQPRPKLH